MTEDADLEWLLGPDDPEDGEDDSDELKRLGFNSLDEFIAHIEEERRRIQGDYFERPPKLPAAPHLPGRETGELAAVKRERSGVRQVGIKLREADYEMLAEAAALYGVAPSTLARMLVRRGTLAIFEREREAG